MNMGGSVEANVYARLSEQLSCSQLGTVKPADSLARECRGCLSSCSCRTALRGAMGYRYEEERVERAKQPISSGLIRAGGSRTHALCEYVLCGRESESSSRMRVLDGNAACCRLEIVSIR